MEKMENFNNDIDKEDEDNGSPEDRKARIKSRFFEYCKKGELNGLMRIIDEVELDAEDDKKWTGLIWAVINNHKNIVKAIIAKEEKLKLESKAQALSESQLIKLENEQKEKERDRDMGEVEDVFKKPLNPANYGKYNPLHWSAYKGNILITSILIKAGYKPIDIDNYGNTALHQAAASNNLELFKLFMGLGIDLEVKNARSHMAIDLTSNKDIKDLIHKTLEIKNCQICNKLFDFFTKRFFCYINCETVCKNCCMQEYYYENVDVEEKEIFECRCKNCFKYIVDSENNLKNAIKSNNLEEIYAAVNFVKINKIKICPKLNKSAEFEIDRLEREKKIYTHLENLKVVENHKTIEKSVYMLDEMLKDAQIHEIPLDNSVIEKAHCEKSRLLGEKELRRALNNYTVDDASLDNLAVLTEKVTNAKQYNVEAKFVEQGEEIMRKMQLNIGAKDILELLCEYPIREYPKPEDNDPKKKKEAEKNKGKKKKKDPPFIIPDWAKEINTLVEKSKELKNYMAIAPEIGLDANFLSRSKEQLSRFDQEIKFRRAEDEMLKKLEEEKKKKAKKK